MLYLILFVYCSMNLLMLGVVYVFDSLLRSRMLSLVSLWMAGWMGLGVCFIKLLLYIYMYICMYVGIHLYN